MENAYKREVMRMLSKLEEKSNVWQIIYTVIRAFR